MEHVDRRCTKCELPKGAVVPLDRVWRLAGPWDADRLDERGSPRTPEAMERLLADAGLRGDFWRVR